MKQYNPIQQSEVWKISLGWRWLNSIRVLQILSTEKLLAILETRKTNYSGTGLSNKLRAILSLNEALNFHRQELST
jgi:hypothetical protein